jgi:hypothetical protein
LMLLFALYLVLNEKKFQKQELDEVWHSSNWNCDRCGTSS